MKREKTVAAYTCDCCGAEIDDRSRINITMHFDGEVWYEWWACGDYCHECAERLADAIVDGMQVPERCDKAFQDKEERIRNEVEMIREVADD